MKKLIGLLVCLILVGCATQQETSAPDAQQQQSQKAQEALNAKLAAIKIGTPRAEVERALGQPVSVKDSAEGSTVIWAFGRPPGQAKRSSGALNQFGNIAATAAGYAIPFAGLVTQIGTSAWAARRDVQAEAESQAIDKQTLMVTIEFKEDKVVSIQRARPFLGGAQTTAQ